MTQSLFLWFWSVFRVGPFAPQHGADRLRIEIDGDGEPTARDYEVYYWNPSPGPWY
ncbi:hypothetical protein JNB88_27900 [Rhizobium cauense]|uniref:hypothetical protein n=1 Tax=Rhizobium cauense TaxID=1166683 RepID=UPI001C6F1741|nr:hypothetical protein [Rhizobium cauense]MBW9117449.1 hypothetical protein [Rhizobium cauense]